MAELKIPRDRGTFVRGVKTPTSWWQSSDPSRPLRPVADIRDEPAVSVATQTEPGERWGIIQTKDGPVRGGMTRQVRSWGLGPAAPVRVSEMIRRLLGSGFGFGLWSGREDLNLDSFPGREACCNYTTSAKSASDEADTFAV